MPHSRIFIVCLFVALFTHGWLVPVSAQVPLTLPAPAVSPATAHAVLKRVLASGEFQRYNLKSTQPSAASRQFERIWHAILTALDKALKPLKALWNWLIRRLFHSSASHPSRLSGTLAALGKVLPYLVYVLLGGVVLFLLGLLVHSLLSRRQHAQSDLDVASDPSVRRKQEPSFWERTQLEAEALWQQGNAREALRLLHRACLILLDARGVLRYEESRANGEILRELRRQGRADVQRTLSPIVRCFDRSWYGFLPVSGEEFTTVLESSRQFRESVVGGSNA